MDNTINSTNQPSKEMVRQWLKEQIGQRRPPPDPEQIRRDLKWELKESSH